MSELNTVYIDELLDTMESILTDAGETDDDAFSHLIPSGENILNREQIRDTVMAKFDDYIAQVENASGKMSKSQRALTNQLMNEVIDDFIVVLNETDIK